MRTYARIEDCRVVEIVRPFVSEEGVEYAIEDSFTPQFVATLVEITNMDPAPVEGMNYINGVFSEYVPPPPTAQEILASQSAILQQLNQLAAAQKSALANRIGVISDAIEFEEATAAEIAELPVRQAQQTAWKRYAVLLGRVTTQEGWPPNVIWPEQPAEGMDLTISASKNMQASI